MKEPGPGQLTQQIPSWKAACLVSRTQPGSSSLVYLLLGGLQEALGLRRTSLENQELGAVIWAAVYARRAQQTFTTPPPARGLTPPPHPSRTRELGTGRGGGWGTRLEQSPGETGQGDTEGVDGLQGLGAHPQVERMRPQVAEASHRMDGECPGPHQETPGPGERPRLLQPIQALHFPGAQSSEEGHGVEPWEHP